MIDASADISNIGQSRDLAAERCAQLAELIPEALPEGRLDLSALKRPLRAKPSLRTVKACPHLGVEGQCLSCHPTPLAQMDLDTLSIIFMQVMHRLVEISLERIHQRLSPNYLDNLCHEFLTTLTRTCSLRCAPLCRCPSGRTFASAI